MHSGEVLAVCSSPSSATGQGRPPTPSVAPRGMHTGQGACLGGQDSAPGPGEPSRPKGNKQITPTLASLEGHWPWPLAAPAGEGPSGPSTAPECLAPHHPVTLSPACSVPCGVPADNFSGTEEKAGWGWQKGTLGAERPQGVGREGGRERQERAR